jgi:hypothetical protein
VIGSITGNGPAEPLKGSHPRVWGVVGVTAQALFMAGWLTAETWQGHRYSVVTDTISDMQASTAPHVWFPILAFAAGSIGTFCFAVFGLRPALAGTSRSPGRGVWMLAVAGLAIGNSFPLIPCGLSTPGCTVSRQLHSTGGITDAIVATIAFLVLAAAPGPLWERMKTIPRWQSLAPVMGTAKIVCPVCFVLLGISSFTNTAQGLAERVLVTSVTLWIAIVALTLIRSADRPTTQATHGLPSTRPE